MKHLFFVRHGQTSWNENRRFQGQFDIPLNPIGQEQAAAAGKNLSHIHFDLIVNSGLSRAAQTAAAVQVKQQEKVPIHIDPDWREMAFGRWEGLTYKEIKAQFPHELSTWESDMDQPPAGGEGLTAVFERVGHALERLKNRSEQTICVVAHGGSLQLCFCHLLGLPPTCYWQFKLANGAISEVKLYPAGAIIERLNNRPDICD